MESKKIGLAAALTGMLILGGCGDKDEHPKSDHPESEHPKKPEHPKSEHPE